MEQLRTWGAQLVAVLRDTLQDLIVHLPAVATAAAVLLAGWLLARVLRELVQRALGSMEWLYGRLSARSAERSAALSQVTSRTVSSVVFWIVLLVFAATALRILGGAVLERWTASLLAYLPLAIGGVAIVVVALIGGALVRHVLDQPATDRERAPWIGRAAQILIIAAGAIMGLDQIGIDVAFIVQLFTVAAAALLGGAALAFALGSQRHLANLIAAHYARRRYSTGDHIKVAGFEGRIVEIADGCMFIEAAEGDVAVPAHHLSRDPLVKLRAEP